VDVIQQAKHAIETQIGSLQATSTQLGDSFVLAVNTVATAPKVVTSGLGKSGFIARKLAATLTSMRIPSFYIHPVDALHGDSGILSSDDVLVVFSKSGETAEVIRLLELAKELGLRIIAITGRNDSTVAQSAHAALLAKILGEYDEEDLIPTTSTTTAMVLADILAVTAAQLRGKVVEHLKRTHPDGSIGSALLRTVDEVMHAGEALPRIGPTALVSDALTELTAKSLGLVCVCSNDDQLLGVITDGDVRRLAVTRPDFMQARVEEVMTREPVAVTIETTLHEALAVMERRKSQISALPVLNGKRCVGIIRLHDIVRVGI
jgi:arabinose-5-phosphate isomerase